MKNDPRKSRKKKRLAIIASGVAVVMALAGWYGYLHSPYYAHAEALRKARQGDAAAQYRLCLDYIGGVGREADMAEAAKWALKARAQGYNCEEKIGDDKIIADLHREMAKQQGNAK